MATTMDDPRLLRADAAAASGQHKEAEALLTDYVASRPDQAGAWLKLAAMRRVLGDLQGAIEAISGALTLDPTAFLPLMMKANLLDTMGRTAEAGELYAAALFHAPDEADLPGPLRAQVARARERHAVLLEARRSALGAVAATVALDAVERQRLDRFQSNILRETRVFHSEPSHFHYPGLAEREFHDRRDFAWLETLEAATDVIAGEFARAMAAEHAELVPYVQYPDDVPLNQWKALNRSRDWTAIHLVQNGVTITANARHCPETMKLLGTLDQPDIPTRSPNAMFSLLAPRTRIPPHTGVANTRLVCHLPLIVPDNCWFRVGATRRAWKPGEAWVFDDTIEHEAANDSGELRVILIVDTWHPGLSPAERAGVAAVMGASDGGEGGL